MSYDFRSLLPADFEDLARDLAGKAFRCRFEAFGPGPDGGVDGRHASAAGDFILQAKHMVDSPFASLKRTMKRERTAIDSLAPHRYSLVTSRSLTPANKAALAKEIGPALREQADILGPGDLNQLLRKHRAIERAHLKLWLSSTTVLESVVDAIVHSAFHGFTASTRQEIAAKVRVYAQNPSLAEARKILDQRHVLIVAGPPGVGKTTLAEILAFAYLGEGWDLIAIRSLEDGFGRIDDAKRQIFFFDDFLGSIAFDQRSLASTDSALAIFMNRVRNSPNARFVLTTRAYILNEAKSASERLSDRRVGVSTYVLDLSSYTRAIRARILYNHLLVRNVPRKHLLALLNSGKLAKIVDHKNYNPRVIEWMTDSTHLEDISPGAYPNAFIAALDNPKALWDKAFRNHISPACRHLLIALFFTPTFGAAIAELQEAFGALHDRLCQELGIARDPKDFEESLKRLESGFVEIRNGTVDFINPSVRDYLSDYLSDGQLLVDLAQAAGSGLAAKQIWNFAQRQLLSPDRQSQVAIGFAHLAVRLETAPQRGFRNKSPKSDIDNSDRIDLLLEWWAVSGERLFYESALAIARNPPQGFVGWRDAPKLLEIARQLDDEGYFEITAETRLLKTKLEEAIISLLQGGMAMDDLERVSDLVEDRDTLYSPEVSEALHEAVTAAIENTPETCSDLTSESELDDHVRSLRKLAQRTPVSASILTTALTAVEDRRAEVTEDQTDSSEPEALQAKPVVQAFDDNALRDLFDSLR